MIDRGKRSKTLSEVKPVENINKNLQSFLEISPVQKEVLLSHKLRDHAYEYQNPFGLKEDNLSQRNCQNQLSHPGLSHTARMSGEFDSRKDLQSTKFKQRPQIFVKLSSRELLTYTELTDRELDSITCVTLTSIDTSINGIVLQFCTIFSLFYKMVT